MEPQLGLYVRLGEILGLRFPTIGIRARLGLVVVWMVFPRLDPGSTILVDPGKTLYQKEAGKKAGCSDGKVRRYEKGGIVAIVEGEAHGGLGLRGGLVGPSGGVDGVPSVSDMIKGGIVAIVEGEAHCALGLRGGLLGVQTQSHIDGFKNRWDLPRDIPLDRIEVFRYDTKGVKIRKGIMQTKTELTLEQTQQVVSDDVLVFPMVAAASPRQVRFIATCSYPTNICKDIMKAQVHVSKDLRYSDTTRLP
ncbi:hypothetical protein Tco_0477806 [Tanacetum coccineum]